MRPAIEREVFRRLVEVTEARSAEACATESSLEAERYLDPARLERERALLRRVPVTVGRGDELPSPGSFVTREVAGAPLLLVRGDDGRARAFFNVCRHRGSILEPRASGQVKAFTCRYHAWTYQKTGELVHVPMADNFPSLDRGSCGLVEVGCQERHGFLWVGAVAGASIDVGAHLGAFDDDLSAFGFAEHRSFRKTVTERNCNWKLVLDAFLEGYHACSLHQKTLARYFLESVVFDFEGPHVRQAGARKNLIEQWRSPEPSLRAAATLFYLLFPNTVLILHPDWVSYLTAWPLSVDRCRFEHTMLVPGPPAGPEAEALLDKSFRFIDGEVYANEDLAIAESVQQGLSARAFEAIPLGRIERPLFHFHHALGAMADAPAPGDRP